MRRPPASDRTFLRLACAAAVVLGAWAAAFPAPAAAQERPLGAVLLDRMCAHALRTNEEDRLLGMISITARTTIKYQNGLFSPDLIDDAVQDSTARILEACPRLAGIDDAHRVGIVVGIVRDTTLKLLTDPQHEYSQDQLDKATAADLSQEL